MSGIVSGSQIDNSGVVGAYPAGHVVQTTARVGAVSNQTVTNSPVNGTWYGSVVEGTITPIYSNSSIIVNAKFAVRASDTGGDFGYGFRFYKSATGITDGYPDGLSSWDGAGSVHSALYRADVQYTTLIDSYNIHWIDDAVGIADTTVTYTLYASVYNMSSAIAVGAVYESRWDVYFQEIKR
jgi:hypothetical protein